MIRQNGSRAAFTLVELMVVMAMIAVLIAAMTTSIAAAKRRAKIQKATSEVKIISQAILAYENFRSNDNKPFELPVMNDQPADSSSLGFLLGLDGSTESGKIPALMLASLSGSGAMLDPWGHQYLVKIQKSAARVEIKSANSTLRTGFVLPNVYHMTEGERK